MPDFFDLIHQYIGFFPLAAFIALLLAGINIPISEDLVIITGALVCHEDKSLLIPTFAAIYCAVVIGDFACYWLGTRLRNGFKNSRFIVLLFSPKHIERMGRYLKRYGIFTFIVCRFIPFGVRNTLFLSSGFLSLPLRRFALYDIPAATISISTLFFLVYYFGEMIKKPIKVVGVILFAMILLAVVLGIIRIVRQWRLSHNR